ncbi:Tn3 family transposase [Nonomuraea sp. NPDC049400]|uniref:Tn3 family transposase n=1 Tax=Nonomuraea sp. NPDC049400 TaxID=3364352 RepID=UPI0037ADDAB0
MASRRVFAVAGASGQVVAGLGIAALEGEGDVGEGPVEGRALDQLQAEGYPLAEEDVARLSPFVRQHINVIGTYSFARPVLGPAAWPSSASPATAHPWS